MTLEEFQNLDSIKNIEIPRLSGNNDEIKLLWYLDYYDGELTGILEYKTQKCYFHMVNHIEEDKKYYRLYAIVPLSDEEFSNELKRHELFRKHVGWHTDYLTDKCRIQPESEWHKFYDVKFPDYQYMQNTVIALLEM